MLCEQASTMGIWGILSSWEQAAARVDGCDSMGLSDLFPIAICTEYMYYLHKPTAF